VQGREAVPFRDLKIPRANGDIRSKRARK